MEWNTFEAKLKAGKHYKPATLKVFLYAVKKISRELFGHADRLKIGDFRQINKIKEFILKQNLNVQKIMASAVNSMFRHLKVYPQLGKKYKTLFNEIAKKVDNERKYAEPTEREAKMFKPWDEVIAKREELRKAYEDAKYSRRALYNYYIASLFTMIPPNRPSEYVSAVVKPRTLKTFKANYYSMAEHKLYLTDYKTFALYGKKVVEFPDELHALVVAMKCKHLLPKVEKDEQNTNVNVCQCMRRLLGLTPGMLRKIYISHVIDQNTAPDERKRIAQAMSHSLDTQEMIYSKFSKARHTTPEEDK
jgi:hypothetical protein